MAGPRENGFNRRKRVQKITSAGAIGITEGVESIELNGATQITATIGDSKDHGGFLLVKQTGSGTAGHTVTLANGTWNGTATIVTLNAVNEAIMVYIDGEGDGTIIENVGSVALS